MPKERVLLISPHTDDIEIGASALAQHYIGKGAQVRHIAFSPCRRSIPSGFSDDITEIEFAHAQKCLSIDNHHIYDFPVREFHGHRQEILDTLIDEKNEFAPDIVVSPPPHDIHQDHSQMGKEVNRAFHGSSIIYYSPLKMFHLFRANMYLKYDLAVWETKKKAVTCYQSQLDKNPDILNIIQKNNSMLGLLFGGEYVEPFYIEKMFVE